MSPILVCGTKKDDETVEGKHAPVVQHHPVNSDVENHYFLVKSELSNKLRESWPQTNLRFMCREEFHGIMRVVAY